MSVVITGMAMPDKCCKCAILDKSHKLCPILRKRVVDPGTKPELCPLRAGTVADAEKLKKLWSEEPEIIDSINKAVIA